MRARRSFCVVLGALLAVIPWQISNAQTVTLDFASVSLPPGGCTDASAYLATFGITFHPVSPGASAQICSAAGSNSIFPTSSPNFFFIGPTVTNTDVSGDLVFSTPVTEIAFGTTAVNPVTSVPAWDAEAYDASEALLSAVSEPSLFPGPGAMSFTLTGPNITTFHFDAFNSAARTFNAPPIDHITLITSCVDPREVKIFPGTPFSRDGKPLSMNGTFAPKDANGAPVALADRAKACGFTAFNWQQEIVSMPSPSPYFPVNQTDVASANIATDGSLKAPPSFLDPLPEGYQWEDPDGVFHLESFDANPYFYSTSELNGGPYVACNRGQTIQLETTNTLNFQDCPADYALRNGFALQFQTSLVGECGVGATAVVCNGVPVGAPSPALFMWNWSDTFNGQVSKPQTGTGGAQLRSVFSLDPNSGTGGVTITSLNGLAQTPPTATCKATPTSLWPPNGKAVSITVSGTIIQGTSNLISGGTGYLVIDEYGQDQPSGQVSLGLGGIYAFHVPLVAARNGNDTDGRTYTIVVNAQDTLGNVGSCSAIVTVPHDQGH